MSSLYKRHKFKNICQLKCETACHNGDDHITLQVKCAVHSRISMYWNIACDRRLYRINIGRCLPTSGTSLKYILLLYRKKISLPSTGIRTRVSGLQGQRSNRLPTTERNYRRRIFFCGKR